MGIEKEDIQKNKLGLKSLEVIDQTLSMLYENKLLSFKTNNAKTYVFLCGKAVTNDPNSPSSREIIKKYFREKYPDKYNFILAEDIFRKKSLRANLLDTEDEIADFSDSIVIILESESAFAELGAFTNNKNTLPKVMVVNDICYKNADSFINNGLIEKVRQDSIFNEIVYFKSNEAILECAEEIKRMLAVKIKRDLFFDKISSIMNLGKSNNSKEFVKIKRKKLFAIMTDVISLTYPFTKTELLKFMQKSLNVDTPFARERIETGIALMIDSGDFCYDSETGFLYLPKLQTSGIEYNSLNRLKTRAKILQIYRKHAPGRIEFIKQHVGV